MLIKKRQAELILNQYNISKVDSSFSSLCGHPTLTYLSTKLDTQLESEIYDCPDDRDMLRKS